MVDTLGGKKICVSLRVFFAKQLKAQTTSELLRAGSRTLLDMEKQEDLRERKRSVVYVYLKGNEKKPWMYFQRNQKRKVDYIFSLASKSGTHL